MLLSILEAFLWYFGFMHSPSPGNLPQDGFAVHSGNGATTSGPDTGILGFAKRSVGYEVPHEWF